MSGSEVITLGCRLNAFESEVMRANAARAGLSDAIIVNTCAVTKEAERQARQAIRRARRDRPNAQVIVTGCAAQLDPAKFAAMPTLTAGACLIAGLDGEVALLAVLFNALPTASSSYVMARQMGGDAPLMASLVATQTVVAALTVPLAMLAAQAIFG